MVYRTVRQSVATSLVVMTATLAACQGQRDSPSASLPGRVIDVRVLGIQSQPVRLVWLLRAEDCLSCFTPTNALRQVQRTYGSDVGLTLAVVDGDTTAASSFAARERLAANVAAVPNAADLGRDLGPWPVLLLLQDSLVVNAWHAGGMARLTGDSLVSRVDAVLTHGNRAQRGRGSL